MTSKIALVTGAGSGIGRALALNLAGQGCNLAIADVNAAGLKETAEAARQQGVKVLETVVNVADRAAVHAWADEVVREFGKVNLIFNNAGVAHAGTVEGSDYAEYEWIMNINFWGVMHGTKAFLPYLKATGDGHIVNISSIFGIIGVPTQSAYNASKFAVRGFTEALRQEVQRTQVKVSCVHPGGIKTNIAKSARFYRDMSGNQDAARSAANFDKIARTTPAEAARVIIDGIKRNNPRILIGADARLLDRLQRLMPVSYTRILARLTGSRSN